MKKFLSIFLSIAMVCSIVPFALATNDYTQGTLVQYIGTGSESYQITVPAQLRPGTSGTVTLEGTWAENRTVTVTADETVTLVNSIKASDTKVLDIDFDGISEAGSNVGSQTFTETVSVASISNAIFGTWSGKFNYNVEIVGSTEGTLSLNTNYVRTWMVDETTRPMWMRFYDDGTAFCRINGQPDRASGAYAYDDHVITYDGQPADIEVELSFDGNVITIKKAGEAIATYQIEDTIASPIKFNTKYIETYDADNGIEDGEYFIFYEDNSMYVSNNAGGDINGIHLTPGSTHYSATEVFNTLDTEGHKCAISSDGKTLTSTVNGEVIAIYEAADSAMPTVKLGEDYAIVLSGITGIPKNAMINIGTDGSLLFHDEDQVLAEYPAGFLGIYGNYMAAESEGLTFKVVDGGETIYGFANGELAIVLAHYDSIAERNLNAQTTVKFGEKYVNATDPTSYIIFYPDGHADGAGDVEGVNFGFEYDEDGIWFKYLMANAPIITIEDDGNKLILAETVEYVLESLLS